MTKHFQQSYEAIQIQSIANMVFNMIFTLECLLKLIAYGLRDFFRDAWCAFDIVVIIGSWIDIVITEFVKVSFVNTSFFRLFRAARIAQLVGRDGDLKKLSATLLNAMKSVPSIAVLMGLIIYVYAILGVEVSRRPLLSSIIPK